MVKIEPALDSFLKESVTENKSSCQTPIITYKRQKLVEYCPDEIIGNLSQIAEEIESFLFKNVHNDQYNAKEKYKFICIVNPPRHGKSLLLDRLFCNREEDVRVIEITYNSNSNIFNGETRSVGTNCFVLLLVTSYKSRCFK
jgi:hypothetical protein